MRNGDTKYIKNEGGGKLPRLRGERALEREREKISQIINEAELCG